MLANRVRRWQVRRKNKNPANGSGQGFSNPKRGREIEARKTQTMRIYKFKDAVDGKFAFILAKSLIAAEFKMKSLTSIPFILVESRGMDDLKMMVVIRNDILPF